MSLSISILASGSSGNCSALRCDAGLMLIDCGIGPRATASHLKELGVSSGEISAICLTHLDSDHFNCNWIAEIITRNIRVFCHESRVANLCQMIGNEKFARQIQSFNGHAFFPIRGISCDAIHLPHDQYGSHGFLLQSDGVRIGYATDLGRVPTQLIRQFVGVDILAIESNYDPEMQLRSGRPEFLRQRIMGGRGHLSNQQAFDAVQQLFHRCLATRRELPRHIALLHRSRQSNCPNLVREVFGPDSRLPERLTLAEQCTPTDWLTAIPSISFAEKQLQFW